MPIIERGASFYRQLPLTNRVEEWELITHWRQHPRHVPYAVFVAISDSSPSLDWREVMSWYPPDGTMFFVGSTTEQGPLDIVDVTDPSWQEGTGCCYFRTPSQFQESRISIGLSQDLDWIEVMSRYAVGGATYAVTSAAQQEPESIDACWWSSPLKALAIARDSAQPKPWDLGDDGPWWRWDPRGLLVGERSVWDPGIERSLHVRGKQRSERFQWRIWDPGPFCSVSGEHQLERRLVQALFEDKQLFFPDEVAT